MKIALDYISSARIWRSSAPDTNTVKWGSRIRTLDGFVGNRCLKDLECLVRYYELQIPVKPLVNSMQARGKTKLSEPKLWSSPLATNSLYPLESLPDAPASAEGAQIYVSSPEFCLLQAAATHELPQIILYGMEICSTFSLPLHAGDDLVDRVPLTSAKRIAAYIEHSEGSRGYRGAARAVPFILGGSASPMESKLAMKLVLPSRLGGMGFPAPILNYELPLSLLSAELAGKEKYRFDLWWPDASLVVEYDSEQEHMGRERIAKDSVRRNIIDYLELNLVTITPSQLMHEESFALAALEIAHRLGIRMRPPSTAVQKARHELNRQLFPWRYR